MRLEPVMTALEAALGSQLRIAGDDPQVETAGEHLLDALGPALRSAAIDLAQQAAAEVDAQLPEHTVGVMLSGDDIELRVDDAPTPSATPDADEELDARITLRLPPTLKQTVERLATVDGESVNSWVVETLSKRTNKPGSGGRKITQDFDL